MRSDQFILFVALLPVVTAAFAEEAPAVPVAVVPTSAWKANAALGYIATSGTDSRTQAFKGDMHGEWSTGNWTHEGEVLALSTRDALADSSTERYLVDTKSSRDVTAMDYLFVASQWEHDREAGYKYQAGMNAGYGHYLLKDAVQHLSLQLGIGERHSEPEAASPENDAIGALSLHYHYQFNAASKFTLRASIEDGRIDRVIRTLTELKSMLNNKLAMSICYDYKNDDSHGATHSGITSVNLNYQFD